ncbi:MAG: hypothetical protein QOD76_1981 [Solirubrobacteraceae bacterium]|nr:hypothetical protein [Solirubrobacteraceae bacterium]
MPSEPETTRPRASRPRRGRDGSALGRFEKVGAWLGVWTPPKDIPVPPVPKRRILVGLLIAAAILTPVAILAGNAIDTSKDAGALRERRRQAALDAAERRRLTVDQRPRTTRAPPTPGLAPAAARAALVADLQRAIGADARLRARRGSLDGPIGRTICEKSDIGSEAKLAAVLARYRCTVVTGATNRSVRGFPFVTGYVFVATIHFDRRTLTWCKANPRPGEQGSRAAIAVKLSPSCAGPLRDIY